jgi:hypothetical protein
MGECASRTGEAERTQPVHSTVNYVQQPQSVSIDSLAQVRNFITQWVIPAVLVFILLWIVFSLFRPTVQQQNGRIESVLPVSSFRLPSLVESANACVLTERILDRRSMDKAVILPPKFRPASEMKDSNVPLIDDANYLYKLMIDTNNALKDLRTITKNTKAEEYGLYESYKQVTGLADPTHPKLVQRQVRGLLRGVFGIG